MTNKLDHLHDIKQIFDYGAVGGVVAVFFDFLPDFAALLSVIWLLLRIWEMETVKKLTGRWVEDGQ